MAKKILFYYCFILALFITVSGVLSSQTVSQLLMQFIFLPVTIYFSYSVLAQFIDKNSSPLKEIKTNKLAAVITIILFFLLFILSISKISKKPLNSTQDVKNIITSPSPKKIK